MTDAARLLAGADAALAQRDFETARLLLEQAGAVAPDDPSILLKLAGVSRAAGRLGVALDATHRALALAPLDFTALLMRATLLERMGDKRAGEAWGHALAQRPEGAVPGPVAAALGEAERKHAAWSDARDGRFRAAMSDAVSAATPDERARIDRFRTNALRRTKPYHSEPTHFHFPGLVEREFHDPVQFDWCAALEQATGVLTDELHAVMAAERAELVPYIQYADHQPLDQWRPLNRNRDWTAIHLWRNGEVVDANARHCPMTMALLETLPQPVVPGASPNAMFSLLAPHTHIPPHVGVSNNRLVCHLPLIVPPGCWFRVGAERREWERGRALVFDDTIEHEAMNPTDDLRVVFIFDIWHPGLSATERSAVAALIGEDSGSISGAL